MNNSLSRCNEIIASFTRGVNNGRGVECRSVDEFQMITKSSTVSTCRLVFVREFVERSICTFNSCYSRTQVLAMKSNPTANTSLLNPLHCSASIHRLYLYKITSFIVVSYGWTSETNVTLIKEKHRRGKGGKAGNRERRRKERSVEERKVVRK